MFKVLVYLILLFSCCFASNNTVSSNIVSRKRRWLIFPKGSSLQLVYCFLYSTYGTEPGIFVIGFTVGLAWEIPTDLREYFYTHGKEQLHVRDRRQLYKKIEIFLDAIGHDGRKCVLHSICTVNKMKDKRLPFIQAIFQTVFKYTYFGESFKLFDNFLYEFVLFWVATTKIHRYGRVSAEALFDFKNLGDVEHWLEEEDHLYRQAGTGEVDCDYLYPCNLTLFQQYPP